jgi:hypothetical protein
MKQIIKWIAEDGAEFNSREACDEYERLCADVQEVLSKLPKIPDLPECSFENGGGYLQHSEETIKPARDDILHLALKNGVGGTSIEKWITAMLNGEDVHASWPGRAIDECCPAPLRRAWYRFMCMDSQWREWGQPYYANHPEEAKQIRLN